MIIDIEPVIVEAGSREKLTKSTYGYPALYHFRYADGDSASVHFTPDHMRDFQPNREVSDMIKSWEQGIEDQIQQIEWGLEHNKHPQRKVMHKPTACPLFTELGYRIQGEVETVHDKQYWYEDHETLDEYGVKFWTDRLAYLKAKQGKIIFEKVV